MGQEIAAVSPEDRIIWRVAREFISPCSQADVKHRLRLYFRWHAANCAGQPISRDTVFAYRQEMLDNGLAPRTIMVYMQAIRSMVKVALREGEISEQVADSILSVPTVTITGRRTGTWLTKEEVLALLEQPDTSALSGLRDFTVLALLVGCGMRRAEVMGLTIGHIQEMQGNLMVVDFIGKGRKQASVVIPQGRIADTIRRYCQALLGLPGATADSPLVPWIRRGGAVGGRVTDQVARLIVQKYAEPLGLSVLPHDLRRTFAGLAEEASVPVQEISRAMRHESVDTTIRYLAPFNEMRNPVANRIGL